MGKNSSEVENEVFRFVKILLVVVVLILGVYLFTNRFIVKEYDIKKDGQAGEISSHNIIVGSLLNRPHKEYYVMAYKSKNNDSAIYDTYLNLYENKEDSLRMFIIDLDNSLNSKYYSEVGNTKATSIDELQISSPTLIKVNNGKIAKYIEGQEKIKQELGI